MMAMITFNPELFEKMEQHCRQFGFLMFVCKLKEWQQESVTERLKLLALEKNIYLGKLANFSLMTWTSLFGKHDILDYKTVAAAFYMQTGTTSALQGWLPGNLESRKHGDTVIFFPFRQKLRTYCSRQIIKIAELIYWLEQNVHAVPFYIVISRLSHFRTETTWLLKKTKDKCFLFFHKNSLSFKWNILSHCNGKNGFNWYSLIPSSHKLPSF